MAARRWVRWVAAGAGAVLARRVVRSQWRGLGEAFEDAEDPYGGRFVVRPGSTPAPVPRRRHRLRTIASVAAEL